MMSSKPVNKLTQKKVDGPPGSTLAVDLGGTHVRVAVVEADGTIVDQQRATTPIDATDTSFLQTLTSNLLQKANRLADRAVVGLPGVVDHVADELTSAPNLPQRWLQSLTAELLSDQLGCEVSLANDADLAAVGEARFGAGRGFRDVVYVTISTGVGAGLVVDKKLVRGTHSGGEVGHTVVDAGAAADGRPATVEDLGSGTALLARAAEAGLTVTGPELAELVRERHPRASEVWEVGIGAVGIGIANLAWMVAPQVVVVGGGVGMNHDLVAPIIARQLRLHGPSSVGPIEVVTAELGDDAALAGSAAWWEAVGRG